MDRKNNQFLAFQSVAAFAPPAAPVKTREQPIQTPDFGAYGRVQSEQLLAFALEAEANNPNLSPAVALEIRDEIAQWVD